MIISQARILEKVIYLLIILLITFLPFYSFLRVICEFNNFSFLLEPLSYFRDIIILILFFVAILYSIARFRKLNIFLSYMTVGVLLLLLNYCFGILIGIKNGYSFLIPKAIHISIIPLYLYFALLLIKEFIKKDINDLIIKRIQILAIVIVIFGLVLYFIKPEFYIRFLALFRVESYYWAKNYIRMVGIFFQPNSYAAFISIALMITINKYYLQKNRAGLCLILLFSFAVIMTLSRGAWMSVIVSVTVSLFYWKSNRVILNYFFKGSFIVTIILIIIFLYKPNLFHYVIDRFSSLRFSGDAFDRSNSWGIVLKSFINNPFGHGIGIGGQITHNAGDIIGNNKIPVIDGFYIKTIAETGIVGIVLFFAFSFLSIVQLINAIRISDQNNRVIHITVLSIFCGVIIQCVGSNVFDFINIGPYIWLLLGISNNLYIKQKESLYA